MSIACSWKEVAQRILEVPIKILGDSNSSLWGKCNLSAATSVLTLDMVTKVLNCANLTDDKFLGKLYNEIASSSTCWKESFVRSISNTKKQEIRQYFHSIVVLLFLSSVPLSNEYEESQVDSTLIFDKEILNNNIDCALGQYYLLQHEFKACHIMKSHFCTNDFNAVHCGKLNAHVVELRQKEKDNLEKLVSVLHVLVRLEPLRRSLKQCVSFLPFITSLLMEEPYYSHGSGDCFSHSTRRHYVIRMFLKQNTDYPWTKDDDDAMNTYVRQLSYIMKTKDGELVQKVAKPPKPLKRTLSPMGENDLEDEMEEIPLFTGKEIMGETLPATHVDHMSNLSNTGIRDSFQPITMYSGHDDSADEADQDSDSDASLYECLALLGSDDEAVRNKPSSTVSSSFSSSSSSSMAAVAAPVSTREAVSAPESVTEALLVPEEKVVTFSCGCSSTTNKRLKPAQDNLQCVLTKDKRATKELKKQESEAQKQRKRQESALQKLQKQQQNELQKLQKVQEKAWLTLQKQQHETLLKQQRHEERERQKLQKLRNKEQSNYNSRFDFGPRQSDSGAGVYNDGSAARAPPVNWSDIMDATTTTTARHEHSSSAGLVSHRGFMIPAEVVPTYDTSLRDTRLNSHYNGSSNSNINFNNSSSSSSNNNSNLANIFANEEDDNSLLGDEELDQFLVGGDFDFQDIFSK